MKRFQIGWLLIVIILIVDSLAFYQFRDFETIKIALIISLAVILLFFQLTITIDDDFVKFYFGIGLIRGKYSLADIECCKPISYFPLGLGIRFRPGVILFNVSGTKAIELTIKGKNRRVWIGTNNPDELSSFINDLKNSKQEPTDYTVVKNSNNVGKNKYFLIVGIVAVMVLFTVYGNQDSKITFQQKYLKISGLYGTKINYDFITQIDTLSQMPNIVMRTNGYAFGKICKGNFRLNEIGKAKLFVNFGQTLKIQLRLKNNELLFINYKDRQETIKLYDDILEKIIKKD